MEQSEPQAVGDAAPVVLVQGGVHSSVVADLREQLAACGYTPHDKSFYVVFFCDFHGKWNARPFGLDLVTDDIKDFEDTNIHPVSLRDPTMLDNWQESHLRCFYGHVAMAKEAHARGAKLLSVCMKGANRSKALQYALDPQDAHLPRCVAMQAAARGYRNERNLTIAPLGPPRLRRSKTAADAAADDDQAAKKPRKA